VIQLKPEWYKYAHGIVGTKTTVACEVLAYDVHSNLILVNAKLFLGRPNTFYVRVGTSLPEALRKGQAAFAPAAGPDQNLDACFSEQFLQVTGLTMSTDGPRIIAENQSSCPLLRLLEDQAKRLATTSRIPSIDGAHDVEFYGTGCVWAFST
jgi:hypothetical protein